MINLFGNKFYFARHGETEYNSLGMITGAKDIPLNDKGVLQAKAAYEVTSSLSIKTCICSHLKRAHDTATYMLGDRTDINPIPYKELEERRWGLLEGTHKHLLDHQDFTASGVEDWEDFYNRTINILTSLNLESPVLIVAHSGTFRVLCEYLSINIVKAPVRNAWPYCFFKTSTGWSVQEIDG